MVAQAVRGHLRRADIEPIPDRRRTDSASAIMLAALDYGPVARSTIARIAGLSPAAVSRQCAELIRHGLLQEVPNPGPADAASIGRPHVPVDIDVTKPVACGVHLALWHATLALVDLRGRVVARERIPHDATPDPALVLGRIAARLPGFIAEAGFAAQTVRGIGVATGGWVDSDAGVIAEHTLLGWRDVRVRELLERRTGLPVRVDGHSRALARAEQLFGDQRARSSVVHLFAGNVVDAAFAVGGTVQHGPRSASGTVAHLPMPGRTDPCGCGRHGCLQAVVSEGALAARAATAGVVRQASFPLLLEEAVAGNPRAVAMFLERAREVGAAASMLLDLLNPEVLVVVEAGAMRVPGALDALRAEIRRRSQGGGEPPVVTTSFGRDVLHVAAGSVMLSEIYVNPLAT